MQWKNRGNELIKYKTIFSKKNILIYGAGYIGGELFNSTSILKKNIDGWVDCKGGKKYGLPVYKFTDLTDKIIQTHIFIIATNEPTSTLFVKQLLSLGLKENIDFFRYMLWNELYRYLYLFFRCNCLSVAFCGLQISNVCNLNCKGCLSFTHFIKKPHFYGKDYLKNQLNYLFNNIDYIGMLELCGGEPFLIPNVKDFYEYTGSKYRDRIGVLSTVTNGTVIPSDDLCEVLKKYKIKVYLDDYRKNVNKVVNTFDKVYEKLCNKGVDVEIRNVENWIDLGITENKKSSKVVAALRHAECNNNRMSLINGKLFFCDYECYAYMAEVYNASESDYLDISEAGLSKSEVLEFSLGYSQLGYCSMCGFCNGDAKINKQYIKVAEQY